MGASLLPQCATRTGRSELTIRRRSSTPTHSLPVSSSRHVQDCRHSSFRDRVSEEVPVLESDDALCHRLCVHRRLSCGTSSRLPPSRPSPSPGCGFGAYPADCLNELTVSLVTYLPCRPRSQDQQGEAVDRGGGVVCRPGRRRGARRRVAVKLAKICHHLVPARKYTYPLPTPGDA